jgi:hypothetical protein
MHRRGIGYGLVFATMLLPPVPVVGAPQPTEDFYLNECLSTGHEQGVCQCLAKAFTISKDVNPELVSAIMQEYLLKGDVAISPARIKQDLPKLKITATDSEIEKAVLVAKAGTICEEC